MRDIQNRLENKLDNMPELLKRLTKPAVCMLLIISLVFNPFSGALATSLNNQEFFLYHTRDLLGLSSTDVGDSEYYLATGTYENTAFGKLFGIAKERNLIVLQIESLQNIMIGADYNGQELTPNLNKLIAGDDTLYFQKYYQQLGSGNSSDSEFVTNNSLIGSIESYTYNLYQNNYFKGLPWILKENGYSTAVFHGNDKTFWNRDKAYPKMGFDTFINSDYFKNDHLIGSGGIQGVSDKEMFRQSIDPLLQLEQPFYGFFVTLSSHHPYVLPDELKEIELKPEDEGTIFGDYINAVHYADEAVGEFIQLLKDNGLYETSVIALYGDHFGLALSDPEVEKRVSELIGKDYTFVEELNIPLIISVPGKEGIGQTLDIVGGESDFLPTIAYLMGIEKLDTLYLGQNLLTADSGFVAEQTHLLKGSFINDEVLFEISRDGVFNHSTAYDMKTGEVVSTAGYEDESARASQIIDLSEFYLENDVLSLAIEEGMTIEEVLSGTAGETYYPSCIASAGAPWGTTSGKTQINDLSASYDNGFDYIIAQVALDPGKRDYEISPAVLLNWMDGHRNANILIQTSDDPMPEVLSEINKIVEDEYSDYLTSKNGALSGSDPGLTDIGDKIVPVLESMKDYTKTQYSGYKTILFAPDLAEYSEESFTDFFAINTPWAVAVRRNQIDNIGDKLGKCESFIYGIGINDNDEGTAGWLQACGVDGIITEKLAHQ